MNIFQLMAMEMAVYDDYGAAPTPITIFRILKFSIDIGIVLLVS
jgi:hypothetical protein